MSDNAIGGLVVLFLVIAALPFVLAGIVIWVILANADEIAAAMVVIGKGIWQFHKYIGYGLLWLVRDLPVRLLPTETWPEEKVRKSIVLWLTVAPALSLGTVWLLLASLFAGALSSWMPALLIVLPSVAAIGVGYYQGYFERPVQHYRWPRFMAQYHLLRAEGQLSYIERSTELRFWFEQKKGAMRGMATQDK